MAQDVFVTGGSGLVGRSVVAALVARGDRVRALARSETAAQTLREAGATPVAGDLLDPDTLLPQLGGMDVVYHVAGLNAFCLGDPSPLYRVNVDGSRAVVRAAAAAGVGRLVHTSSAATIGEPSGAMADEHAPHRGHFISHYERSKHQAERLVLAEAADRGLDAVCVNPSSVQGPGRAGGTTKLLISYLNGGLRAVVDTRLSLIDIDDCAAAHLRAADHAARGERYLISGATLTVRDGLALLGELTGVQHRTVALPRQLALAAGTFAEGVGRLRGRTPSVCREMVRTLAHGHHYDGSRAQRELGVSYTPLEHTLARLVRWLVDAGHVTAALPRVPAQGT